MNDLPAQRLRDLTGGGRGASAGRADDGAEPRGLPQARLEGLSLGETNARARRAPHHRRPLGQRQLFEALDGRGGDELGDVPRERAQQRGGGGVAQHPRDANAQGFSGGALRGLVCQRRHEPVAELGWKVGAALLEVNGSLAALLRERVPVGKRRRARGQLVEHRAQREDVDLLVGAQVELLLGGHVLHAADDLPGETQLMPPRARDAEVAQLHAAAPREQHVLWRHVAVHELERPAFEVAQAVQVRERGADLGAHLRHHRPRHRPSR